MFGGMNSRRRPRKGETTVQVLPNTVITNELAIYKYAACLTNFIIQFPIRQYNLNYFIA